MTTSSTAATSSEAKVAQMKAEIAAELARIEAMGGAATEEAIAYMKESLVAANAARVTGHRAGGTSRWSASTPGADRAPRRWVRGWTRSRQSEPGVEGRSGGAV